MGNFFHHDSGRIFYTDNGKGLPVVLIHGYLETSAIWEEFADGLADRFRVIAVDLPGHGKSDIFGEVHSMDLMADAVHELLIGLETGPVFMIGHSMGGYATMAFIEKYPDMLRAYCLFHSHPFPDSPERSFCPSPREESPGLSVPGFPHARWPRSRQSPPPIKAAPDPPSYPPVPHFTPRTRRTSALTAPPPPVF